MTEPKTLLQLAGADPTPAVPELGCRSTVVGSAAADLPA